MKTFPSPEALRRFPFGMADLALLLGTFLLLALVARLGAGALVSFAPPQVVPQIDLDPRNLPYYAGRSTLRMFIALFFSTLFTLVYGYMAANNRWAERVMISLLDILQSVPVLGFLSITVTGFIALFPGSLLGLEAASIFAIFTSQVWNMTFSFYQSLRTVPMELQEVAALYQLSRWQRFTTLEVPTAVIGLLWNAMMSFGGGWFFVVASEAISVLNQSYTLPGIGSYVAAAIADENLVALGWAFLTIAIVILLVDQLFWRPLIAWSDKFRMEQSASAAAPESWVYNLLQTARIPRMLGNFLTPATEALNRLLSRLSPPRSGFRVTGATESQLDRLYTLILLLMIGVLIASALHWIMTTVGLGEVFKTFGLGILTLLRVTLLLLFATVIWTPIGVAIGFNPKLARTLQPVVQFLASFPANFIFPFATLFFLWSHLSLEWGSILLMALVNPNPFNSGPLIVVEQVSKRFLLPDGKGEFTVLKDVSLTVKSGEVIALLGRSGSGKSTLLRIMAGLIPPSEGQVYSNGQPLRGANNNVAMVFQSFALLPWLTVQENVELGLEARGVKREERRQRALQAIDIVGLDGFESAYPKELSGGMKQRVGFARAFVLEPQVLFMDEPFSALDVLTSENLRGEIDDLWNAKTFPSKSILIVTHNIEEAVFLADRVVILGSNPGRIRGELVIDLPRPHDRAHPRFSSLVDYVYTVMTNPKIEVTGEVSIKTATEEVSAMVSPYARALPHARVGGISGLLELLVDQPEGTDDLPRLADRLQLEVDDLLPILDAAVLLGFATVSQGDVQLTEIGQDFATTTILRSKDLFRQQALTHVAVLSSIVQTLREKRSSSMRADLFLDVWDEHFPHPEAERQFATTVDWGRYAELFEYDASEDRLYLPDFSPAVKSTT